jgi:hypothetical protein
MTCSVPLCFLTAGYLYLCAGGWAGLDTITAQMSQYCDAQFLRATGRVQEQVTHISHTDTYVNNLNNSTRCFVWSVASTLQHRLRVFENRVLRAISGPLREHAT